MLIQKETWLYLLLDPITKAIMYVGASNNHEQRLRCHEKDFNEDSMFKNTWINNLKKLNLKPVLVKIAKFKTQNEATIAEKELIENYAKELGFLNIKHNPLFKFFSSLGTGSKHRYQKIFDSIYKPTTK